VRIQKGKAQESAWRLCWLKGLQLEMQEEQAGELACRLSVTFTTTVDNSLPLRTMLDMSDRLLIARLSLDPVAMANS